MRKHLITISIVLTAILVGVFYWNSVRIPRAPAVLATFSGSGTIDKHPGDPFDVDVTFKNIGDAEGTWSVNVAFEDGWTWEGTPQSLTLAPGASQTKHWDGNVPATAPVGSTARLVVYYDTSYEAQDWWIHVIGTAELDIVSSTVS